MTTNQPLIVPLREACIQLGISRPTFMDWLDKGRFPGAFKVEKVWRVPVADIEALKANNGAKQKRPAAAPSTN